MYGGCKHIKNQRGLFAERKRDGFQNNKVLFSNSISAMARSCFKPWLVLLQIVPVRSCFNTELINLVANRSYEDLFIDFGAVQ